jgi:uncharacterized protein (DUF983 family)
MEDYPHPSLPRMLFRAMRRRCPLCGNRGLFRAWLEPRPACPRCQLKLDRGENDFFLGGYTLNFIAVELALGFFLAGAVALTWPDVPWRAVVWIGAPLVIATPLLFYPITRLVWLAVDLSMRPPTRRDFPEFDDDGRPRVS